MSDLSEDDTDRLFDLYTVLCDWIGSKDPDIARRVLAMLDGEARILKIVQALRRDAILEQAKDVGDRGDDYYTGMANGMRHAAKLLEETKP